jgi:glutamine synthetase adenylyltransferase
MDNTINSCDAEGSALASPWQMAQRHSGYLRNLLASRPQIATWLGEHAAQPVTVALLSDFLAAAAPTNEETLKRALRRLRQRVMATLIVRDLGGAAPLGEVVESMTQLADVTTNFALDFVHRQLASCSANRWTARASRNDYWSSAWASSADASSMFPPTSTTSSSTPRKGRRLVAAGASTTTTSFCASASA